MEQWEEVQTNAWKPQKSGDFIVGVYVNKQDKKGELGARYYIETLNEFGKTEMKLFWGSTILDDLMQAVKFGDKIRVTFKEKKEIGKGKSLNIYKVEKSKDA